MEVHAANRAAPSGDLALGFGLSFQDLYSDDGLRRVDAAFLEHVGGADAALAGRLAAARAAPDTVAAAERSALMLALAPHLDDFVAILFAIPDAVSAQAARHMALAPLFQCKRLFVQRIALKRIKPAEAEALDGAALRADLETLIGEDFSEQDFAAAVTAWMADEDAHADALEQAARYAAWAALTAAGRRRHAGDVLFKVPGRRDFAHLIPLTAETRHGVTRRELDGEMRPRQGFGLTDAGCDLRGGLDEAHYCIYCHHQGVDSCSRGMRDRKSGEIQVNPLGRPQYGCPLEEKISEMHEAKAQGLFIAALACVTLDNPMCAGTGHRICNDCMVACIYQKQRRDPVDIPQAETRTLKDVLALPWGFEIYGLLTRWNPFNLDRPVPAADSGRSVLVVGLGPAGYTLAHHLINDGHTVVAIDGLKIEPLDPALSGVTEHGARVPFRPIRDIAELTAPLDDRVSAGFGGVAEYGITVRWDKNFLTVLRLLLERRARFAMFGGVRFGGTLTEESAFAMGFDHVSYAMGAGKPTIIPMKHGLARGVRQASDFLMALQLSGAARERSVANLQLRLPVAVIGGGLTAIDTATEALAYYPVQVEKFLDRYETLAAELGAAKVRARWTPEETEIGEEFLAHGRAVRAERRQAAAEGRPPRLRELVDGWGGVTLVYRRTLEESPAYRNNHEEVAKALEEGIRVAERLSPERVELDQWGHAGALHVRHMDSGEAQVVPARAVLVAAGTVPNTTIAREYPGTVDLDGKYFQAVDDGGAPVTPVKGMTKPERPQVLRKVYPDGRAVSFFGDQHPSWAGNVVSAMASAKQGYPVISRLLARRGPPSAEPAALIARLNDDLRAVVHEVIRLTPTIVEVVVRAPLAARRFQPGQFYRLQNYERFAKRSADGTVLAMEGIALTGAWTDAERGLLGMIVLEMGGSSDLCRLLEPGEPVVVMGPTGAPTEIPSAQTVLLAGGGLGNAVLFSIGKALRAAGSRVVYFAGYKAVRDRFKVADIEAAADVVVWCCDAEPGFPPNRPGDKSYVGNIVEAMAAYAEGQLGPPAVPMEDVDRIIAIGSDRMMQAVAAARHSVLKPYLKETVTGIGSINSPMQCMMKEICAQCLQVHRDPRTGETEIVYSCFNQDQPLDLVDFGVLHERLSQNSLQEKLTALWIDHQLHALGVRAGGRWST